MVVKSLVWHDLACNMPKLRGTPLWPTYSFQTINKPNCNPSFIATLSLPPIDLVVPISFNSFTTSAAFSSKRKSKQQVAFLACQALSELHLPPTLYNLTKTVPPQDLIENQYRPGQPLLQSEYSFHTVTTPNQNLCFVATISLPPIDLLPRQVRKELNYELVCLRKTMQQPDSHGPPTKRPSSPIRHSQGLLNTKKTKLVKSSGATPLTVMSNTSTHSSLEANYTISGKCCSRHWSVMDLMKE
ncbi:hypothetical protein O181_115329 [Austropuccinia psidii MF-1]|uniref:Dicer dsRNA-binding fold domain-containing protein n=1 Tax=Austropuccinia psidii MF-1 TaxID=1389203 RepID=A0A9Q3PVI3_9BASI|nr:hypothetical protein [Austropuccinia psidii MF-1]